MKKVFASAVAALCAAVMGVSFAGCGKSGESADVNAEAIVGHEVTEAQWDAAFDKLTSTESVYTVHGKWLMTIGYINSENELTASATQEYSGFSVKNGRQEHMKIEQRYTELSGDLEKLDSYGFVFGFDLSDEKTNLEETNSLEYYYNFAEGSEDFYEKDWGENEWTHYHRGESAVGSQIEFLAEACKGNLAMFHYDREKKGYVTTEEIDEFFLNELAQYTVIKFDEQGNLVALLMGGENEEYNFSYSSVAQFVVEYTAEEISFPTNFIER